VVSSAVFVFFILLLLISLRIPVAYSLGFVGLLITIHFNGIGGLGLVAPTLWSSVASYPLAAAVLFIFLGSVINHCGLGSVIYAAIARLLYFLPGSAAVSTTMGCAILAALNGSSVATAAAVGGMAVKEMQKLGYKADFASGTVAAAGTLGIIIPPSIPLIIYGIITEQSIRELFIAGIIPGIILAIGFSMFQIFVARRGKSSESGSGAVEAIIFRNKREYFRQAILALRDLAPIAVLIFCILGSIYTGIATITESAAIGAVGSFLIALMYRKMTLEIFKKIIMESSKTASMVGLIIVGAMLFGYGLTTSNIAPDLAHSLTNLGIPRWGFFIIINLMLIFLGCFMEVISILVITMPVLLPIIVKLGWDPVWFGIIFTINMEMALITPPVGLNLYVVQGVANDIPLESIAKGAIPYVLILMAAIIICGLMPQIVLWLPKL
jgi:C4-dicarboxylate transporter DctM subunit